MLLYVTLTLHDPMVLYHQFIDDVFCKGIALNGTACYNNMTLVIPSDEDLQ